ncbi:hypothetical protein ACWOE8_07070 [Enterococcus avium]
MKKNFDIVGYYTAENIDEGHDYEKRDVFSSHDTKEEAEQALSDLLERMSEAEFYKYRSDISIEKVR